MRAKEILRAKTVRRALSRLFPISALPPTLREAFGASTLTSEENTRDEGWSTVATKKRKLAGRPLGAASKAKTINKDVNQSIFSFTNQSQSTRGASETPKTTQPTEHSRMNCDDSQAGGEA
jgi:hypothetical protein